MKVMMLILFIITSAWGMGDLKKNELSKLGAAGLLIDDANRNWRKRDIENMSNKGDILKGVTIFGEYDDKRQACAAPKCPTLSGGDMSIVAGVTIKIVTEYGVEVEDCPKVVEAAVKNNPAAKYASKSPAPLIQQKIIKENYKN
jgi:hypothetical protein